MGDLVGYARVSTRDQTVVFQFDTLREAGCERILEEIASGTRRDRPQLAAALDYMRPSDALVAWKLDRLARSTKQLIETVEELARRQIGFRRQTQDIDTTTVGGRLVFTIFSAIAEFEREIILERTRAGLDAARARGRRGSRPPALKPHYLKEARALLSDPEITVEKVAARLRVSPSTLYRHLPGGRSAVADTEADPARTTARISAP